MDIAQYKKIIPYLKRQNDTYEPIKSKVVSMENVTQFLKDAGDETYLFIKVALIFGLNGACRRSELCNLTVNDIEDTGSILVVTLRDTKTQKRRIFTITTEINGYQLYHKYFRLRPTNINHRRFFLCYKNGKCSVQPVGINTFASKNCNIFKSTKC